mgnify:CR=1 FL=1
MNSSRMKHNTSAVNAYKNFFRSQIGLNANLGRLSSSLDLNSASGNSSDTIIAVQKEVQVAEMKQVNTNAQQAHELIKTSKTRLIEIRGILTLMREIAEQSVTDSVTDVGRVENDMEFRALGNEITRIASETEHNGIYILDGSFTDNTLRIGFDADENQQLTLSIINATEGGLKIVSDNLQSVTDSRTVIDSLGLSIEMIDAERSKLGVAKSQIQFVVSDLTSARQSVSQLTAQDTDYVLEATELAKSQIVTQSGTAILSQASAVSQNILSLLQ